MAQSIDPGSEAFDTSKQEYHTDLCFYLNGKKMVIRDVDPALLLSDYLRSLEVGLTGTKVSCGEGGCGACSVMVAHKDPNNGKIIERVVNSCLRPICSLDGMAVTTIEGIGNTHSGPNPLQKRIVSHNGSQCGYCTPGFVMTMYGLLRTNPTPSHEEVENQFDGNLCRCTGFRPILEAMHTFADDPDVARQAAGQPLAPELFGEARRLHFRRGKREWFRVFHVEEILTLLDHFHATQKTVKLVNGNTSIGIYKSDVYDPTCFIDISQVSEIQHCGFTESEDGLVLGGGVTYTTLLAFLDDVIASQPTARTRGLKALRERMSHIAGHQVRNAGTLAGAIMMVKNHVTEGIPFPSDLFTVLAALGCRVTLRCPEEPGKDQTYSLLDMPLSESFPHGFILLSLWLPFTHEGEYVRTYKVARRIQNSHAIINAGFRVTLDANQVVLESALIYGGVTPIAFPACKTAEVLRAKPWTEQTLAAALPALEAEMNADIQPLTEDGMSAEYRIALTQSLLYKFFVSVALEINQQEVPEEVASAGVPAIRPISYGRHGFMNAPFNDGAAPQFAMVAAPSNLFLLAPPHNPPLELPKSIAPLTAEKVAAEVAQGKPMETEPASVVKIGAILQATGEVKYTHDIGSLPQTLSAHYVYSHRQLARFSYMIALDELAHQVKSQFPGVEGYITAADMPQKLAGDVYSTADPALYDPVFATDIVTAYGQPIGLVVADTAQQAAQAAAFIQKQIVYDTDGLHPITTIAEAVAAQSFMTGQNSISSIVRPGSDTRWLANPIVEDGKTYVTGCQETGAQAHFYMETQATLAVPQGMGRMLLYCSSQHIATCQQFVAQALNITVNKVEVKTTQLGGGFGGKEVRPPYFAAAAAVAAWTLNKPVRLALDRNTDMIMVGKRHPFEGKHRISADASGRIEKMRVDFFADAGFSYDCTLPITDLVLLTADSAYNIDTFEATRQACRTNVQTNTAMRSFGIIQGTLIVENAIEHLAYTLGQLPEDIREHNFYRDATLTDWEFTPYGQALQTCRINQVWNDFRRETEFDKREQAVREFNKANRWRKRGISMIPIKYGISYTYMPMNQGGAYVMAYSADGSVLVKHGGVEMGQGIHTKIARIAADTLGIDMALIRVGETDTADIPNAVSTGASTGTDLNGGAVLEACKELRERLVAFCEQSAGTPNFPDWKNNWPQVWPAILKAAYKARINLSAVALYGSPKLAKLGPDGQLTAGGQMFYYFTYSAAVSEVEIDSLTGEFSILRSDLIYDSGKSINSLLDYGQIEGGFVQGIGNVTTEQIYFADDGRLIPYGTWNYKIPCSKTIPIEFNVSLLKYVRDTHSQTPMDHYGIQSSKSTGEPPLVLAASVFFAIKHAILAARAEAGVTDWFELASPATVERIQQACLVNPNQMNLTASNS